MNGPQMQTLTNLFAEWNNKYFQGKLSNVSLRFYQRRSSILGFYRVRFVDRSININTFKGYFGMLTEADNKHTLLHEMVHAYLHAINLPHGHTPLFKRMLKDLTEKEFGFRPSGNVRFHVNVNGMQPVPALTKQVPIATLLPSIPTMTSTEKRFKVLSNGIVGTFIRESIAYGRKMVTIKVEGEMFPFTTELSNVVAL